VPGGTPPIPNSKGGGGKAGLFGLATTAALAGGALAPALSGNVGSLLTEAGNLEIASGSLVGGQEIAGMTNAGSKGGRTAKMLADLKARLPNVDLDSFFAKFGGWASGLPGKISAFVDKIPFLGGVRGIGSKVRTFGSGALDKISSIPGLGKMGKLLGRALGPIFAIMESAQFVGAAKSGDFATAGELGLSLLFQAAGAGLGGLFGALGAPISAGATIPAGMSVGASLGMASGLIANGIMKKLTPPVDLSGFGKILADLTGLSPELESADDLYIPSKGSPIKLNEKDEVFATKPGGAMEQAMAQNIGKMKAAFTATMNARKLSSEVVTSSAAEEEDRMARAFTKALIENKDNMPPINIHVKVPLDKRVVGEVTMETLNRKLNPANYFIE
jgi:hypothetical protein